MPSIPVPVRGNNDSMYDAVMALKQAVEMLMGTRGENPVTRTFVQKDQPSAFVKGDVWVNSENGKVSYWDDQWLPINVT